MDTEKNTDLYKSLKQKSKQIIVNINALFFHKVIKIVLTQQDL